MSDQITIERGRDGTVPIRCWVEDGREAFVEAKASAAFAAGVTSITIDRLGYTLSSGDMLQVVTTKGDGPVFTLGAGAAIGATSLTVTATPGPIKAGEVMRKLSDITGYTLEMRILAAAGDLVPIIPVVNLPVTIADQTVIATRGIANVAVDSTDTSGLTGGPFFGVLWRTDASNKRSLWEGAVNIVDAGGVVT